MSEIEINETNIIEVLEKLGYGYSDCEVLSNQLSVSECPVEGEEPCDFIVRLDHKFYIIEVADHVVSDEEYLYYINHLLSFLYYLDDEISAYILILTAVEDDNDFWKEFSCLRVRFKILSLKNVELD